MEDLLTPIEIEIIALSDKNPSLAQALSTIAIQDNSYWRSEIGNAYGWLIFYTIGEFWRCGFDSTYPFYKIGNKKDKGSKDIKKLIKAEAALWLATLTMLERLSTFSSICNNPASILRDLIIQGGLLRPYIYKITPANWVSATERIRQIQSENQKLFELDNPFKAFQQPTSYYTIKEAIKFANRFDNFRSRQYKPVCQARSELVKLLREQHVQSFVLDDGGKVRTSKQGAYAWSRLVKSGIKLSWLRYNPFNSPKSTNNAVGSDVVCDGLIRSLENPVPMISAKEPTHSRHRALLPKSPQTLAEIEDYLIEHNEFLAVDWLTLALEVGLIDKTGRMDK